MLASGKKKTPLAPSLFFFFLFPPFVLFLVSRLLHSPDDHVEAALRCVLPRLRSLEA